MCFFLLFYPFLCVTYQVGLLSLFLKSENLNIEVTVVIAWSDYPHIAHTTSESFKYLAHHSIAFLSIGKHFS